jgi:hypothetical protein
LADGRQRFSNWRRALVGMQTFACRLTPDTAAQRGEARTILMHCERSDFPNSKDMLDNFSIARIEELLFGDLINIYTRLI